MNRDEFEECLSVVMGSQLYHRMKSEDAIRQEYIRLTTELARVTDERDALRDQLDSIVEHLSGEDA